MVDVRAVVNQKTKERKEGLGCEELGTFFVDERGYMPIGDYPYEEARDILLRLLEIGYFTKEMKAKAKKCFEYYGIEAEEKEIV